MECAVCCETFNTTVRKAIECRFCNFKSCRSCVKTYMFGSINQPHCMSCKNPWTLEKIADEFPKTFWNGEFRNYQEQMLLQSEKALLPETQRELYEISQRKVFACLANAKKECDEMGQTQMANQLEAMIAPIREEFDIVGAETNPTVLRAKKANNYQAVCNCPRNECRGFIQMSNYKCGMCDTELCKKCYVAKETDNVHVCKPEDIETAKLLRKDTKACPGCNTLIYKIDGCDQMWCIVCKKAFSWTTGEFEKKVHNPHYYEWIRASGREPPREPGDNPCGENANELRTFQSLQNILNRTDCMTTQTKFHRLHRAIMHNHHWVRDSIQGRYRMSDGDFRKNLRIAYLRKQITEDAWKRELVLRERKNQRSQAILNVLDLYVDTTREIINSFTNTTTKKQLEKSLTEINNLVKYCNTCLTQTAKLFNTVPYQINDIYMFTR